MNNKHQLEKHLNCTLRLCWDVTSFNCTCNQLHLQLHLQQTPEKHLNCTCSPWLAPSQPFSPSSKAHEGQSGNQLRWTLALLVHPLVAPRTGWFILMVGKAPRKKRSIMSRNMLGIIIFETFWWVNAGNMMVSNHTDRFRRFHSSSKSLPASGGQIGQAGVVPAGKPFDFKSSRVWLWMTFKHAKSNLRIQDQYS